MSKTKQKRNKNETKTKTKRNGIKRNKTIFCYPCRSLLPLFSQALLLETLAGAAMQTVWYATATTRNRTTWTCKLVKNNRKETHASAVGRVVAVLTTSTLSKSSLSERKSGFPMLRHLRHACIRIAWRLPRRVPVFDTHITSGLIPLATPRFYGKGLVSKSLYEDVYATCKFPNTSVNGLNDLLPVFLLFAAICPHSENV
jgi:hypothetical protein